MKGPRLALHTPCPLVTSCVYLIGKNVSMVQILKAQKFFGEGSGMPLLKRGYQDSYPST